MQKILFAQKCLTTRCKNS